MRTRPVTKCDACQAIVDDESGDCYYLELYLHHNYNSKRDHKPRPFAETTHFCSVECLEQWAEENTLL